MTPKEIRDLSASVKYRLLALARERREDLQLILTSYALERLLYRISRSAHRDQFVVKGALLFSVWTHQTHRMTRDLDLLGRGTDAVPQIEQSFRELCALPVEPDGIEFLAETVTGEEIREEQEYGGVRITMQALLGKARIPVQVDIGFGDAVTPGPEEVVFPTLLDLPAPRLRGYPRETVIAEKLHAMAVLGIANSRMKDFYDLWILARLFEFDGDNVRRAIAATFAARRTPVPTECPFALTEEFAADPVKQVQWQAFVRRGRLMETELVLSEVAAALRDFLVPPTLAAAAGAPFHCTWQSPGPWLAL